MRFDTDKRKPITRAALEQELAEAVRNSDPECAAFVSVIVEQIRATARGGANWAVKGVRFGKADRERCGAALSTCVSERQQQFELTD
jgi:hypothetical protein